MSGNEVKHITEEEAYEMYLNSGYINILPFKSGTIPEVSYIELLEDLGYIIED